MLFILIFVGKFAFSGVESQPLILLSSEEKRVRENTVRLEYFDSVNKRYHTFCSGYTYNPGKILTAKHCIVGEGTPGDRAIFVNLYNRSKKRYDRFPVSARFILDESRSDDDIAMLTYQAPRNLEDYTNLSIPMTKQCDSDSQIYVAGFGLNDSDEAGAFRISYYAIDKSDASIENGHVRYVSSRKGKACSGDSGGPSFCKYKGRLMYLGASEAIDGNNSVSDTATNVQVCKSSDKLVIAPPRYLQDLLNKEANSLRPSPRSLQSPASTQSVE